MVDKLVDKLVLALNPLSFLFLLHDSFKSLIFNAKTRFKVGYKPSNIYERVPKAVAV